MHKEEEFSTTYEKGEPMPPRADLIPAAIAAESSIIVYPRDTIHDSIMAKVRADDYVDLRDILTKGPKTFTAAAPLKVGDDSTISYVEQPKGPLSMGQWNLAFDRYADAYIDCFPKSAPDLRRYGMLIRSLMLNHPSIWAQYDEEFW